MNFIRIFPSNHEHTHTHTELTIHVTCKWASPTIFNENANRHLNTIWCGDLEMEREKNA